jgi:hypothetical protein
MASLSINYDSDDMHVDVNEYARVNDPDADGEYVDDDASPTPSNSLHRTLPTHVTHQVDSVSWRHSLYANFSFICDDGRIQRIRYVMIDGVCI